MKKIDLKVSFEQGDLLSLEEALVEYLENVRAKDGAVFGKERTKTGYKMVVGVLNMTELVLQFDLIKGGIEEDTKNKLTIVNKHLEAWLPNFICAADISVFFSLVPRGCSL